MYRFSHRGGLLRAVKGCMLLPDPIFVSARHQKTSTHLWTDALSCALHVRAKIQAVTTTCIPASMLLSYPCEILLLID